MLRTTHVVAIGLMAGAVLGLSGGCSLNRQAERAIWEAFDRPTVQDPVADYATLPQVAATPPAATQPAAGSPVFRQAEEMQVPEHLRDYLLYALEHNPEIHRAEQVARARAARVPQATALDDPTLMTRTLPEPVMTAGGNNYFTLTVSQNLPVPAKLDARGRITLEDARAAIAEWEQVRQRVIADVKRTWFRLYVIDRSLAILQENLAILHSLVDVVRAQIETGRRSQAYLLRVQVELEDIRAQMIELRQQRVAAAATLNALLGREPTAPVAEVPTFGLRQTTLQVEQILEQARRTNPRLEMLQRAIDRDRQAVRLARLAYWPDFALGFEWMPMKGRDVPNDAPEALKMAEEGSDNWGIMFGFNIPIWFQKTEAAIRQARYDLAATQAEFAATRNTIFQQVQEALADVRAQQELAELFAESIVPQAQQAYESALSNYRAGAADFEFLIENWQKWLRFQIQYHRALGGLERAVADLEQALGVSLASAQQGALPSGESSPEPQPTGDER